MEDAHGSMVAPRHAPGTLTLEVDVDDLDKFSWEHFLSHMEFVDADELETLILMRLAGKAMNEADGSHLSYRDLLGDQSVSEEEVDRLREWARSVRIANALLDNALSGKAVIASFPEGDDEPSFRLSPKGEAWARNLAEERGLPLPDGPDRDWGEGAD